ncbi:HVA22-like protein a isoform X1 [Malania oleifera]|uniref:HVA22-like protein a isoform X1 n=1 Tax=Malania oleifera TaxID=397392 RepID=UPI0025AE190E|nr:HVA22-like protein a isoform X1 [Malania oleifera]XP_057949980.1 HVA22-like protein a isoform X1 [Malania oleifera]
MGRGSENFLAVVTKGFDALSGPAVALVYPMYASIRAIESRSFADGEKWLRYWVLYSLITLFNLTLGRVLEVLPFWSYAKLIAVCWLVLPCFNGAPYVYEHFIRPFYWNAQTATIWHFPMNRGLFHKQDDLMTAAEKYMKMHGTEAFERLIKNAEMARAMRRENMQYDEHYR